MSSALLWLPGRRRPNVGGHPFRSGLIAQMLDSFKAALADRYRIEREIGRGGMGTVFLARDLKHGRPVALKILNPELAAALGPERFQREIAIAAGLNHPHIVALYDSGQAGGTFYYTMPYVEGESLRAPLLPLSFTRRMSGPRIDISGTGLAVQCASGTRIMLSARSQATSAKIRNAVSAVRNAGPDRSWSHPVATKKRVRLIN